MARTGASKRLYNQRRVTPIVTVTPRRLYSRRRVTRPLQESIPFTTSSEDGMSFNDVSIGFEDEQADSDEASTINEVNSIPVSRICILTDNNRT